MQSLGLNSTEVTDGKKVCYIDTEVYAAVSQKRQKLKSLVEEHLHAVIQEDCHSSVIDARAAMAFFKSKQTLLQNCIRETKPTSTLNPKKRPKRKTMSTYKSSADLPYYKPDGTSQAQKPADVRQPQESDQQYHRRMTET